MCRSGNIKNLKRQYKENLKRRCLQYVSKRNQIIELIEVIKFHAATLPQMDIHQKIGRYTSVQRDERVKIYHWYHE